MSEAKFPRLKLPAEVDVRRRLPVHGVSTVHDSSAAETTCRPEAPLMDDMPEPINRAERRYRDRMQRRASGGSS